MEKLVFASQYVTRINSTLKSKVTGTEGGFDEVLVKARFEDVMRSELEATSTEVQ